MSDQNYFLNTNIIGDFNDSTMDDSGYGSLSAAEKNQTYFAYFSSVGGTGPEIIDQTAYFIKYLIDSQGNVVAPQPNSIDVLNMVQNFEPGKTVNVTSLEGTTVFNTLLGTKTITDIGKIETLLVSQTGSGIRDFTSSLEFASSNAIYTYSDWNFGFLAQIVSTFPIPQTFATASFLVKPYDPNNQFNTSSNTFYYTFGRSTSAAGNPVSFKTQLNVTPAVYSYLWNNSTPVSVPTSILLRITTASAAAPTSFDHTLITSTYNIPATPVENGYAASQNITLEAPYANFESGDRVRVEISGFGPPQGSNFTQVSPPFIKPNSDTYFTLTPQYQYNITSVSPYFTTGSINDNYITASTSISTAYYFNMIGKLPLNTLNFSNITNVFHPQPGDYIRFEYNPLKTYKIYDVITNGDNSLIFKLNKGILEGTNINNFVIFRVNPNSGNQIILDVQKPTGTTGNPLTGFIKPQHMTKELEDNFTTIVQKLAAEGTI